MVLDGHGRHFLCSDPCGGKLRTQTILTRGLWLETRHETETATRPSLRSSVFPARNLMIHVAHFRPTALSPVTSLLYTTTHL